MKRFITTFLIGGALLMSTAAFAGVLAATPAAAQNPMKDQVTKGTQATGTDTSTSFEGGIKQIVNVLLFLIGAISVVVIIIGGIMYVVSAGDSNTTKRAKDTILYAVVGLIISLLAYAIVNFVIQQF